MRAEEFLTSNRSKNGIVALPSGVQYRIIEEGEGSRPALDDTVTVHYRGSKIDGREFDSSFPPRCAGGIPGQRCHRRLAGSAAVDAGRSYVAGLSPA